MTLTVYHLKTCDTCRKAIKALGEAGHTPQLVDVRADGVPDAVLARFVAAQGPDVLLNRRSTTWRELSEAERAVEDDAQAVALLARHPTLMKRPVIEKEGEIYVGWTTAVKAALL